MTDADKLRLVIERSGMSARAFATDILMRDERTIRRWLAGERSVPKTVLKFLNDQLEEK